MVLILTKQDVSIGYKDVDIENIDISMFKRFSHELIEKPDLVIYQDLGETKILKCKKLIK